MNKIYFSLFLFLSGCAAATPGSGSNKTLITYEKYDFINSTYINNNEMVVVIYPKSFSLTKPGCESVMFDSSDTTLPVNATKTITGINDGTPSSCYPYQINLDITNSGQQFNNKNIYSVTILADIYNMFLD